MTGRHWRSAFGSGCPDWVCVRLLTGVRLGCPRLDVRSNAQLFLNVSTHLEIP